MSQEITEILNVLAERFGTTVEHLWVVMVRQAYINAIGIVAFYIVTAITTYYLVRFVKTNKKENSFDYFIMDNLAVFLMSVVNLIMIVVCVALFGSILTAIFNPEYWALQQIFSLLGGQWTN